MNHELRRSEDFVYEISIATEKTPRPKSSREIIGKEKSIALILNDLPDGTESVTLRPGEILFLKIYFNNLLNVRIEINKRITPEYIFEF